MTKKKSNYSINAVFNKLTTDHEGESTISFKVPASDLPKALALATMLNKLLKISIEIN